MLLAQGLSPSLTRNLEGAIVLTVPEEDVDRSRAALLAYESENPAKLAEGHEPVGSADSFAASAVVGLFILAFFSVTVISNPTMSWFERGSADAQKILNGELWRTVTALTLHADVAHALSNAFALALFLGAVSSLLGTGLGCAADPFGRCWWKFCQRVSARFAARLGRSVYCGFWRRRRARWSGYGYAPNKSIQPTPRLATRRCGPCPPRHAWHRRRSRRYLGSSFRSSGWRHLGSSHCAHYTASTGIGYPMGVRQRGWRYANLLLDACPSVK